jgi:hypothetical protein
MDKVAEYGLYEYEKYSFDDVIRKYDIGIDSKKLLTEFTKLLPSINAQGWWSTGAQKHQAQFAIQSRSGSNDPYYESCGPQPDLAKDSLGNPLTEGSYNIINDLFKNTYFEDIINLFPFEVTRVRFVRLSAKSCYRLHRDMTFKFHLPVLTNPSNIMIWPEQAHRSIVHMPADGHIYYTETAMPHTALNGGTDYRYHIVFSSMIDRDKIFSTLQNYRREFDRSNFPSLDPEGEWK